MNQRIQHLIRHPFEVRLKDVPQLQDEIEKYPYFSNLRILLLFALKEHGHDSFQSELKKTSIYSPSRVALYHYLQKEQQPESEETQQTAEKVADEIRKESVAEPNHLEIPKDTTESVEVSAETDTTKESPAVSSEMTFSEWLSFSAAEKNDKKETEKDIKYKLIDEFIEKSPKIKPVDRTADTEQTTKKTGFTEEYTDLMTETLAQIYADQRKYDKALRAYRILSLKYPDKKEYFEDKIQAIENLRND